MRLGTDPGARSWATRSRALLPGPAVARAAPGTLPGPCSPTRSPDRPTAHATSSRQEPATLTGPRPCYSGHVTPQALPPSAGRRFRLPTATPPRAFGRALATLLRAPPPPRPRLRRVLSFVCEWRAGGGWSFRRAARVYLAGGFWKWNSRREPNSV